MHPTRQPADLAFLSAPPIITPFAIAVAACFVETLLQMPLPLPLYCIAAAASSPCFVACAIAQSVHCHIQCQWPSQLPLFVIAALPSTWSLIHGGVAIAFSVVWLL